jgi:cell division protease FtsH
MITDYGMSERFRHVALTSRGAGMGGAERQEPVFQREYAESTQQYVDEEIAKIINSRYEAVKETIARERGVLNAVAEKLLEQETLDEKEFKALIN